MQSLLHINMVRLAAVIEILILALLIIFVSTTSSSSGTSDSDVFCIEIERDALLRFKQDLVDVSNRLSSWVLEVDCCKWDGISCDNFTGHVKELNLANTRYVEEWNATEAEWESFQNFKLKGKISDSILNLKYISYLDLSYNDFGGIQIPSFLGSLVSLDYLNLTRAGFQGLIPHQLGNLTNLRQLGLGGNYKLSNDNLQWLQGFRSLLNLDLSYVDLSKVNDWLLEINKLSSLRDLRLSSCELSHVTPLSHVNFTSLSILDISFNNFNSFIPKWILNLNKLVSLNLRGCNLQGPLARGFSNLTLLENLNLESNNLNSSLPEGLFKLARISSLDLSNNNFEGPIPCDLQNMSTLLLLDLSGAHFNSISIPNCLFTLQNLQFLYLRSLKLQGEISNDIANLTNIVSIDLSNNEIEGGIPRSIENLCNLRSLSMEGNKLSEFKQSFDGCLMDSLTNLNLGHNMISGPIPESIGNLSSLRYFDIGKNKITGTLPKTIGSLSSLKSLDISRNYLEGIVSEAHFANLVNLIYLTMSGNNLILDFDTEWSPPFHLRIIELRSCNLGPQFPQWLKSQKNFQIIDLSTAKIVDTIPEWFWSLSTTYYYLNISHNQISGRIPDFLSNALNTEISLSSNKFHGQLPRVSSNVTKLDLSNNSFSGNILDFLCHSGRENNKLEILHFGDNLLSGSIPDCWTKWTSLHVIILSNNQLSGKLPSSIGSLSMLQSLHLRNNRLFGEIPQSLRNCSLLLALDLSLNAFNGSIPAWMGTGLSRLSILGLQSNKFRGQLPYELCHLSSLQIIDIGENNLVGPIPHCFGNFTAMAIKINSSGSMYSSYDTITYIYDAPGILEKAYVTTKGREDQYDTILGLMTSIDLSNNNLSGEIPQEITNLIGLRSLNLSNNNLRGAIPEKIGNMTELESLDFSKNKLSGQIPLSISRRTFLSHFNLSYNNLSGPIPTGPQLQRLDPSNFIGNKLCGPPLSKSCKTEDTAEEAGNEDTQESYDNLIDKRFYFGMIIGFVIGFWGICGPMLVSQTWRHTYYRHLDSLWQKLKYHIWSQ